jgi:ElaB/YqjD/DUF883 family membrane-anchored ribosome-binding protein
MKSTATEPLQSSHHDTWHTKQVIDQAKESLRPHLSEVKEAARHASDEVQAAAEVASNAAREGYTALREDAVTQYAGYRDDFAARVREQPLKSVALAALAGFCFGLAVRN